MITTEAQMLATVLEVAGDNEGMIREGIIKALRNVNDRGRRTYLWNELERRAKIKIRRAHARVAVQVQARQEKAAA